MWPPKKRQRKGAWHTRKNPIGVLLGLEKVQHSWGGGGPGRGEAAAGSSTEAALHQPFLRNPCLKGEEGLLWANVSALWQLREEGNATWFEFP